MITVLKKDEINDGNGTLKWLKTYYIHGDDPDHYDDL